MNVRGRQIIGLRPSKLSYWPWASCKHDVDSQHSIFIHLQFISRVYLESWIACKWKQNSLSWMKIEEGNLILYERKYLTRKMAMKLITYQIIFLNASKVAL